MKTIILKKENSSVRLSGRFGTRFLVSVVNDTFEIEDRDYLEIEGALIPLIKDGTIDVIDGKLEEQMTVSNGEVVSDEYIIKNNVEEDTEEEIEQDNKNRKKK